MTKDPDPAGTNVRAAPSVNAPVLFRLPKEAGAGEDQFAPEFEIIGWKEGWAQIRDATIGQYGDGPEEVIFKGPGWVSGRLVTFSFGATKLRAGPGSQARVLATLAGGSDEASLVAIHDCRGAYAEVTVSLAQGAKKRLRGWITNICSNQATTCTGPMEE